MTVKRAFLECPTQWTTNKWLTSKRSQGQRRN